MSDINNTEEEENRFRVNRINSAQLHQPPPGILKDYQPPAISEEGDYEMNKLPRLSIPNIHLQPRRSSIAQGLGGGRKKSVSLPKEYEYDDDDDGSEKNFNYFTREALPAMDNYRKLSAVALGVRPTLDELRSEAIIQKVCVFHHFFPNFFCHKVEQMKFDKLLEST